MSRRRWFRSRRRARRRYDASTRSRAASSTRSRTACERSRASDAANRRAGADRCKSDHLHLTAAGCEAVAREVARREARARFQPDDLKAGCGERLDGNTAGASQADHDDVDRLGQVGPHDRDRPQVGAGAQVGPYAYLRPGAVVGLNSKAGTFVEIKNSTVGPGSKVPHLSYVGDAEIGDGSNIGAGTIFANYDGVAKHRTKVGRHAKTGSNNTFIAPVTIGDGYFFACAGVGSCGQ